jgi:RNA polymerase sigma-70 factor (ECF subfamily)
MKLDDRGMGALMVRAQRGDHVACRALLEAARDWLMRYYRYRLPPSVVEDAVQDALVAVHAKRATYDGARPFMPWLKAIARYLWIDRLRRMQKFAEGAAPGEEQAEEPQAALDDAEDVSRLLARLKPAQADAIRLVELKGYTVDEAARLTGQSVPLVKVNVHRGVARLAKLVRDFG